jgi:hypothetical protein
MNMLSAKLTKKSNDMNEYFIKSYHSISEDSYNDGELGWVNGYEMSDFIKAIDPTEAIRKYIIDKLYYNFDPRNLDTSNDDISTYYNVLVDADNCEANDNEFELWKQGKFRLYNDSIKIEIYTVSIVLNSEIQNKYD